jgi:membrane protein
MDIRNKSKKFGFLLQKSSNEFLDDKVMKLSAALSYYTIFSLPPLLIIIISLAGFFFGEEAVSGQLFHQIKGLAGENTAMQIQEAIANVKLSGNSAFATIVSSIVLLIGASGVFAEIQDSINYIWGIKPKPNKGLVKFIKNRLMSFSMIGVVGFIMMVGLIVNSLLDLVSQRLMTFFPEEFVYLFYGLNYILIFLIICVLFTVIFKSLPDGKVALRDCIIGAAFTSFLFVLGKFAIGFYLGNSAIASVYGAAGSVILILIWVYYSAIILYFGAEFTKVYAITHGHNIVPNEYSVRILKDEIEIKSKK